MYADLHLHTLHSDGLRTPREVVDTAIEKGLSVIALSDHDQLAGYFEIREYAAERGLRLIPGVELSVDFEGQDIHILAYSFAPVDPLITTRLEEFRAVRATRGEEMVRRLIELGYPITLERVRELCGDGAMGRPHVARALVESGSVATIQQAFDELIGPQGKAWVAKAMFSAEEAVRMIRGAGGRTSVAHPTLYKDHFEVVKRLLDLGVDGIEAWHPKVIGKEREQYMQLATSRGRLITGGSDDHGFAERKSLGTIKLPVSYIESLLVL